MKTSTASILGASALTAAVVGFGVALPSLADEDPATVTSSADGAAETADPQGEDEGAAVTGPGAEGGMRGGPGGMGHGPGGGLALTAAADALGVTEDELLTQLQSGSTLGEVADDAGVERQALVDVLLADQEERLLVLLDEPLSAMGGPGLGERGRGEPRTGGQPPQTAPDGAAEGEQGADSDGGPWQPGEQSDSDGSDA